ncbi:MAG: DUF4097 family beta strand repeat-containing protein [Patescibacteria group bacterium]
MKTRLFLFAAVLAIAVAAVPRAFGGMVVKEYSYQDRDITSMSVEGMFFQVDVRAHAGRGVRLRTETPADILRKIRIVRKVQDGRLVVRVENKNRYRTGFSFSGRSPRLVFDVPANVQVEIDNSSGSVRVRGLRARTVAARASSGSLELEEIDAALTAAASSGSIRIRSCRGDKEIRASSGSLTVIDGEGDITAETSSGNQRYVGIKGDITARSSSGGINLRRVEGRLELQASAGSLVGRDILVTGNSRFRTSSGSIDFHFQNDLAEFSFRLRGTSGGLRAGRIHAHEYLQCGNGPITIEGESTSGSQNYQGR